MQIIDSHVHVWSRERARRSHQRGQHASLHVPYSLSDLRAAAPSDVVGAVLVEGDRSDPRHNHDLATLASCDDFVLGTVAWLDMHHSRFHEALSAAAAADTLLAGFRYSLRGDGDGAWTPRCASNARMISDHNLTLEVLAAPNQINACAELARSIPEVTVVIDHLGAAGICGQSLNTLAACTNVVGKLSGVPPNAGADPGMLRRVVDVLGPSRLMFGSNWPVCLERHSYQATLDVVRLACADLSDQEAGAIFYGTAIRVFGKRGPLAC